jgi:hypothetical protein
MLPRPWGLLNTHLCVSPGAAEPLIGPRAGATVRTMKSQSRCQSGGAGTAKPDGAPAVALGQPGDGRRTIVNTFARSLACFGAALIAVAAGSAPAAAQTVDNVFVPGNAGWVGTGIVAHTGDTFDVTADGQVITLLPPRGRSVSGPDGQSGTCVSVGGYVCAVEEAHWGALIGRIGTGAPFVIGSHAGDVGGGGQSGELMLAVNDYLGYWSDNSGGFAVRVQRSS